MKLILSVLLFLPSVASADIILIVREHGTPYVYDTETRQVVQEIVVDQVYLPKQFAPKPPDTPTPPDTPPEPPTHDEVAERAYNLAASIGNKQDAYNLGGLYRYFADLIKEGKATREQVRETFKIARRIAADTNADWGSVFNSLDKEMDAAQNLESWMTSVADGFARFAGTESATILKEGSEQPESINTDEIFKWIELILTILRLFGISI